MTVFKRGIQLYLLVLAFAGTLTMVWGTNWLLLDNTTRATGWPLMIGISGAFVLLGVFVRHRRTTNEGNPALSPYPWSSND